MRRALIAAAALPLLILAGCSSTPATHTTGATTVPSSAAPSPSPSPAARTAADVVKALQAAGLPVTNVAVQDENSDPNNLIGRPHQYVTRASFELADGDPASPQYTVQRGGVVETFATAADAQARQAYVQRASQVLASLAEYDYLNGTVLVRITGRVKPSQTAAWQAAVAKL